MTGAMERDAQMGGINGSPRQGEQLQQAATGLIDQATKTAEAQASTTMTKVGETLDTVAMAVRDAGEGLRERQPEIAGFVDTAAQKVEEAASYLRDHNAGEAIESVQDFARRQPALVVGGGLVAGLLLGRLLRSGATPEPGQGGQWQQDRGYGTRYGSSDYGGAGGYGAAGGYGGGTGYAGTDSVGGVGTAAGGMSSAYGTNDPTLEGSRYGDVGRTGMSATGTGTDTLNDAATDDTSMLDEVRTDADLEETGTGREGR